MEATVNGNVYFVGNHRFMEQNNLSVPEDANMPLQRWRKEARTVVFFAKERQLLALLSIQDPVKPEAGAAVEALRKEGKTIYLHSGDDEQTARAIGRQLGTTQAKGGLLPKDKADYIRRLQAEGNTVAMVGDGINDAEAMAVANVSIAMDRGSDIALETAKMALLASDLSRLPKVFRLPGKTITTIRQNLFWAFVYNIIIGIPVAAGVLYPFAGAVMALSSVSVVSNSLRLRQIKL